MYIYIHDIFVLVNIGISALLRLETIFVSIINYIYVYMCGTLIVYICMYMCLYV